MSAVLALPGLRTGGAEIQAVRLLEDMASSKLDPSLVLLETPRRGSVFLANLQPTNSRAPKILDRDGNLIRLDWPIGQEIRGDSFQKSFLRQIPDRAWSVSLRFLARTWRKISWSGLSKVYWIQRGLFLVANLSLRRVSLAVEPEVATRFLLSYPRMILYCRRLISYVRKHHVDLLVSFLPKPNVCSTLVALSELIPVAVSERNDLLLNPGEATIRDAVRAAYAAAHLVLPNTEHAERELRKSSGSLAVRWLPNAFPHDLVGTVKHNFDNLCVVSRLEPQKGVEEILRALSVVRNDFPQTSLHILGDGAQRSNLLSATKILGLNGSVFFHGLEKFDEDFIIRNEIGFIVANSNYEGSSNSLHEAVRFGLIPVFAQTIREMADVLDKKVLGVLDTDGSAESIATRIKNLLKLGATRINLGEAVQKDFRDYWNRARTIRQDRLEDLLELRRKFA